jgi:hypothetical protein
MTVTAYTSAKEFLEAAGTWLEREEALNNLMLGIAARLAEEDKPRDPPAVMMTASDRAGLAAACIMTPPRGVTLYAPAIGAAGDERAESALAALGDALHAAGHAVPECVGPAAASLAFAGLWAKRTDREFKLRMAQRIYELRRATFPTGVSGAARVAGTGDLDMLVNWRHEYCIDVSGRDDHPESREAIAERLVAGGRMLLWEDGGRPVSMAVAMRPTRHGIAIAGVYTPPAHRRRGYASACVAELSRRQLDAGRDFCCLYTDLSNPTSNSIYQNIGYNPVADSSHYEFIKEQPDGAGLNV